MVQDAHGLAAINSFWLRAFKECKWPKLHSQELGFPFCPYYRDLNQSDDANLYIPPPQGFNILDCLNEIRRQVITQDNIDNDAASALVRRFYSYFPTKGADGQGAYSTISRYFGPVGQACDLASFWLFFALFEWVYGSDTRVRGCIMRGIDVGAQPAEALLAVADHLDIKVRQSKKRQAMPKTPVASLRRKFASGRVQSPALLGAGRPGIKFDVPEPATPGNISPVLRKIAGLGLPRTPAPPSIVQTPNPVPAPMTPELDHHEPRTPTRPHTSRVPASILRYATPDAGSFIALESRATTKQEAGRLDSPVVATPVRRSARLRKAGAISGEAAVAEAGFAYTPNRYLG